MTKAQNCLLVCVARANMCKCVIEWVSAKLGHCWTRPNLSLPNPVVEIVSIELHYNTEHSFGWLRSGTFIGTFEMTSRASITSKASPSSDNIYILLIGWMGSFQGFIKHPLMATFCCFNMLINFLLPTGVCSTLWRLEMDTKALRLPVLGHIDNGTLALR